MDVRKKDSVEKKLFVAVKKKRWIGQGYNICYPTIHKEEALEYIKHLPFYLTKAHGLNMRSEFLSCFQDMINTTVWNEETRKLISAKDQEFIDTTELYKSMTWLEFDESVDFGENTVGKIEIIWSESDSDESNGLKDYGVANVVSALATKGVTKKWMWTNPRVERCVHSIKQNI